MAKTVGIQERDGLLDLAVVQLDQLLTRVRQLEETSAEGPEERNGFYAEFMKRLEKGISKENKEIFGKIVS